MVSVLQMNADQLPWLMFIRRPFSGYGLDGDKSARGTKTNSTPIYTTRGVNLAKASRGSRTHLLPFRPAYPGDEHPLAGPSAVRTTTEGRPGRSESKLLQIK